MAGPRTRFLVSTMTEESALTHVISVFGTANERDSVRLSLIDGGIEKVSDLRELTFEDLGLLKYTPSVTTTMVAVATHLNILQRRKLLLIPLWYQEQDVHELSTWFELTPELFDTWRASQRVVGGVIESTLLSPSAHGQEKTVVLLLPGF